MFNLVRRIVDAACDALRTIKPKPVRGFVVEICDDLITYPEEWEKTYSYSYRDSLSKSYSKGGIKITHSLSKDSAMLWLYHFCKLEYIEYIPLTRKESAMLHQAVLNAEKPHDEKWEENQKIKDTEIGNNISNILKSYRNP